MSTVQPSGKPEQIFHYTSVATIQKILDSRSLWATHYAYLNDHSELRYGIDVMRKYVSTERRPGSTRGMNSELYNDLLDWLQRDFPIHNNVFVCCLSREGNQLSQWRSYTSPRKGISIGFMFDRLEKLAVDQGYQLVACEYDQAAQLRAAATVMDNIVAAAERDTTHSRYEVFRAFTDSVVQQAIGMKHSAFAEEGEWRLWRSLPDENHKLIRVREGASSLVPYITLDLKPAGVQWPFSSFRVGPTPDERAATLAVSHLLRSYDFVGMRVSHSGIPFRN